MEIPFVGKVQKFDTAKSYTAQRLRHCQLFRILLIELLVSYMYNKTDKYTTAVFNIIIYIIILELKN